MPRKKTEPAEPTAKKAPRSRETKTKAEETKTKKPTAKAEKKSAPNTPRPKKASAKKEKVEAVEAELVQESNKKKRGCGVNNNLVPLSERTKNEQRKIASAGGKASGEARRAKKNLREFGQAFLMQQTSDVFQPLMDKHGVVSEESTNLAALFVRVFNKAMSTGDLNAARQVVEWAGMAPLQEMRENEAIAKMSQAMMLAQGTDDENAQTDEDVVFYIPENGRTIIRDEDIVPE